MPERNEVLAVLVNIAMLHVHASACLCAHDVTCALQDIPAATNTPRTRTRTKDQDQDKDKDKIPLIVVIMHVCFGVVFKFG